MTKINYVALLRGINVGGKNIIKMADLKACFEKSGLENVATYIQSGNVLFETAATNPTELLTQLEADLSRTFSPYQARLVLCSHRQLQQIVASAPPGFGSQPEEYRYDVFFLRQSLTAAETVKQIPTKAGVDELWAGPGVIYFARLVAKATQSQLNKVIGLPIYQEMTIRNWNTTSKLLALLDKRAF